MNIPKAPPIRHIGILNANSAVELSKAHKKKEHIQKWVFRKIKRNAKRGWRECNVGWANDNTQTELAKLGFTISSNRVPDNPGGRGYTIQW